MKITCDKQQSTISSSALFGEVKQNGTYEERRSIFTIEEKLLNHILLSEKDEAQRALRLILSFLKMHTVDKGFDATKHYLISLSSLVARHLQRDFDCSIQAFDFNIESFKLIDSKLNEENTIEFANDLIDYYMHVLQADKGPELMHSTVTNVINFINENVESAMTVEDIANTFNVSTSHLSRIFRENTGTTLVEYIAIRKVEESQYYLRFSKEKISDISDRFYFCNQSYFTRIFKKYTGQTPRRFRSGLTGDYFRYTITGEEIISRTVNHCNLWTR